VHVLILGGSSDDRARAARRDTPAPLVLDAATLPLLRAGDAWAKNKGVSVIGLNTQSANVGGKHLYESEGYLPIEPYGFYRDSPLSRCFEKHFHASP